MTTEAQTKAPGDLPEVTPQPTPARDIPLPPRPPKSRDRGTRRERRSHAAPALPPATVETPHVAPLGVDDLKELERFRFGVWIAKLVLGIMTFIVVCVMGIYTYHAFTTKSAPDMGLVGTLFGHLKEVMVIIIESQK